MRSSSRNILIAALVLIAVGGTIAYFQFGYLLTLQGRIHRAALSWPSQEVQSYGWSVASDPTWVTLPGSRYPGQTILTLQSPEGLTKGSVLRFSIQSVGQIPTQVPAAAVQTPEAHMRQMYASLIQSLDIQPEIAKSVNGDVHGGSWLVTKGLNPEGERSILAAEPIHIDGKSMFLTVIGMLPPAPTDPRQDAAFFTVEEILNSLRLP